MTRRLHRLAPVLLIALALLAPHSLVAQAPDNVRLVFQLVEANGFTEDDPEIADVVSELRALFRFEGYRLAASGLVNSSVDAYASTNLTGGPYQVEVSLEPVREEQAGQHVASSERVRIGVALTQEQEAPSMQATVTVRDGQTLVLGSTRTQAGEALILVMRTRFQ